MGIMLGAAVLLSGNSVMAYKNVYVPMISNQETAISARSVCISNARVGFSISTDGTANMSAGVVGRAKTSKIVMKIKLQKYNSSTKAWKDVKTWNKESAVAAISFSKDYALGSKGRYRCKMIANVYCNGVEETITKTSSDVKY